MPHLSNASGFVLVLLRVGVVEFILELLAAHNLAVCGFGLRRRGRARGAGGRPVLFKRDEPSNKRAGPRAEVPCAEIDAYNTSEHCCR